MKHVLTVSLACSGLLLSGAALAESKNAEQEWGLQRCTVLLQFHFILPMTTQQ